MPNGAGEKFRWGDRWEPPLFYKERLGTGSPPHPPQCAHWGTFPPRGRLCAVLPFPSAKPPPPSPPSWGAGRYGRWFMGRRPGRKKEDPLQDPPNQSRESRGEKLSPLALFPPFLGRNGGPRRVGALRGAAPRGLGKAPPTRRVRSTAIPPRQARAPTKQGPSFFAQFCATFLPPPCTPACNFGPGSPGGERRFCHAHPP